MPFFFKFSISILNAAYRIGKWVKRKINGLRVELFALQHQVNFFFTISTAFSVVFFALVGSSAVSTFATLNVLPDVMML